MSVRVREHECVRVRVRVSDGGGGVACIPLSPKNLSWPHWLQETPFRHPEVALRRCDTRPPI